MSPTGWRAPETRRRALRWAGGTLAVAGALASIVLADVVRSRRRPPPLASTSTRPEGALGLYETAARLGWHTARATVADSALVGASDRRAVYASLYAYATPEQAHRVLEAVRAGAGLLVVARPGHPLSDSLGLPPSYDIRLHALDNHRAARAADVQRALDRRDCARSVRDARSGSEYVRTVFRNRGAVASPERRLFVDAQHERRRSPVVVGFPLGRGRVVAYADGALLQNQVLRLCWSAAGPVAVRALEWATPAAEPRDAVAPRARLVFLERDTTPGAGLPPQPSVTRAVWHALTDVPAGRMLAQGTLAALVLLLAAAPRALAPRPSRTVERRSPLEHVGALARAYREARATRLAARRLVRGLRRRHAGVAGARADDARFLAAVRTRHPARAADAARLSSAITVPVAPAELVELAAAADRIDLTLDAARRGADSPVRA